MTGGDGMRWRTVVAWVVVVVAMLASGGPVAAQADGSPTDRFDHLTTGDGLVGNVARVVHQSEDGIIWVGTLSGLSRYDGTEFTSFTRDRDRPDSLPDNVITALASDASSLWIGTASGWLAQMDLETTELVSRVQVSGDAPIAAILALLVVGDTVWIGTDAGLEVLDVRDGLLERVEGIDVSTNGLVSDLEGGSVWAATSSGIVELATDGRVERRFDERSSIALSSDLITAIDVASDGTVWAGTETAGVVALDPATGTMTAYARFPGEEFDYFVLAIEVGDDGTVWTTSGSRLYRIDPGTGAVTRYAHDPADAFSLGPGAVFDITEDRDGLIWVAKQDSGVARLDPRPKLAEWFRVSPSEDDAANANRVFTIAPVSVAGRPGAVVTTRQRPFHHDFVSREATPLLDGFDQCQVPVGAGSQVWCAGSVLSRIDLATGAIEVVIEEFPPEAAGPWWAATSDGSDGLWLGGDAALVHIDATGAVIEVYEAVDLAPLAGVSTMTRAPDGRLVLGHWGSGLSILDPKSRELVHIGSEQSDVAAPALSDPTVFDVAVAGDGSLLVATNGGLDVFDAELETVRRYNARTAGLPSSGLRGVVPIGDDQAWVTSATGLSFIDLAESTSLDFTAEDGLQGQEFSPGAIAVMPSGEILAGGDRADSIASDRCRVPAAAVLAPRSSSRSCPTGASS